MTDEPSALLPRPTPPAPETAKPRPRLRRWPVPLVALLVSAVTVAVLVVLWRWIDGLALADADKRATAQLDALKLAASIVVGGGGLFALYLAARRQRTQELELDARHAELAQRDRVQIHAEQVAETNRLHVEQVAADAREDATARRITDLFTKASEQLGSDKAPVRLAGIYALERLAQDNPRQRQTVVNVLCAYLRMPYELPGAALPDGADDTTRDLHRERTQEREVRLTAQEVLTTHLRPGSGVEMRETFWPDIDINLRGATLTDFDCTGCRIRRASFIGATFTGIGDAGFAGFHSAVFALPAVFIDANFLGNAVFRSTTFASNASFTNVKFASVATFSNAAFSGGVWFSGASFAQDVEFDGTLIAHPIGYTIWPTGWRPADQHAPVEGREGTWHALVQVDPDTADDDGEESTAAS